MGQFWRAPKNRRIVLNLDPHAHHLPDPEPSIIQQLIDTERFEPCWGLLNDKERQLLTWRFIDELSYKEIASRLDSSIDAAYTGIFRARRKLTSCIAKSSQGGGKDE